MNSIAKRPFGLFNKLSNQMNRFLTSIFLFFLCHLDIMGQGVFNQVNEARGDVNGDGVVNTADIVAVVNDILDNPQGQEKVVSSRKM